MATHTQSKGTKFYRGLSGAYTEIARVVKIQPPDRKRTMMDVSDIDDDVDIFGPGNITPGKLSVTLRFSAEEATQQTLHGDLDEDDPAVLTTITYKIVYSDAAEQVVSGLLESWEPQEMDRSNDLQVKVAIQCTGDVPLPA